MSVIAAEALAVPTLPPHASVIPVVVRQRLQMTPGAVSRSWSQVRQRGNSPGRDGRVPSGRDRAMQDHNPAEGSRQGGTQCPPARVVDRGSAGVGARTRAGMGCPAASQKAELSPMPGFVLARTLNWYARCVCE